MKASASIASISPIEEAQFLSLRDSILSIILPDLNDDARRVALALYRELARGAPVRPAALAETVGLEPERTGEILAEFSGVYFEAEQVVGFWGLTAKPVSDHRIFLNGLTLHGWCAWDTLFIPGILGETAKVESADPETGEKVRMTVSPEAVTALDPETVMMSVLVPKEGMMEDIVSRFCHYIHFFTSRASGERWTAKNPDTSLIGINHAFELGRIFNQERFGELLAHPSR